VISLQEHRVFGVLESLYALEGNFVRNAVDLESRFRGKLSAIVFLSLSVTDNLAVTETSPVKSEMALLL
jgi:hypothetical protein